MYAWRDFNGHDSLILFLNGAQGLTFQACIIPFDVAYPHKQEYTYYMWFAGVDIA